jgi:hypothetical protein
MVKSIVRKFGTAGIHQSISESIRVSFILLRAKTQSKSTIMNEQEPASTEPVNPDTSEYGHKTVNAMLEFLMAIDRLDLDFMPGLKELLATDPQRVKSLQTPNLPVAVLNQRTKGTETLLSKTDLEFSTKDLEPTPVIKAED